MRRRSALAALVGGSLLECRGAPPDRRLRLAVADLAPGQRVVLEYLGEPVEVVRSAGHAVARSLLCSHYGCRVEWQEERRRYQCPCHEGAFDEHGRPLAGPPTRPLRQLPVEISGDAVLLGER